MKLKTYKYITYYIFSIAVTYFLYINFPTIKSYFSNFYVLTEINQLKQKDNINIGTTGINDLIDKITTTSGVSNTDLANVYFINEDLDKAEQELKNKKKYNYYDFYNLANIYLLKSYYGFKNIHSGYNDTYIDNAQKAIINYNYALNTIPSYKKKYFIIHNTNIAKEFLNYLYFYNCNGFFISFLNNFKQIYLYIDKIQSILKKQLLALKKREKYNDLKKCITSFKNDAINNSIILDVNKSFFENIEKGAVQLYKENIKDSNLCYKNLPLFKEKYNNSLKNSIKYFKKFYKLQNNLLTVFQKGKKYDIEYICEHKGNIANKQGKLNSKMEENYKNLRELMPNNNKKNNNKGKANENNKNEKKNKNNKNEKNSSLKKIESEIEKQQKKTIENIQKVKTQNNYTPMEYINRLFKGFYGNEKDYLKGKKENSIGK